jgi:RNA 3'-terminal phosphate cyclase-like protein
MPATALKFRGHQHLRLRLVLAIISGKAVQIDGIRSNEKDPGLRGAWFPRLVSQELTSATRKLPDYEVNFLRLLEKITNGSHMEISYTGMHTFLQGDTCTQYV